MGDPRQGIAQQFHSIHIRGLKPEIQIREPAEKNRHVTTTATGALVAAIRVHRRLSFRRSLFAMATGLRRRLVIHPATFGLRGAQLSRTTDSLHRETDLNCKQKDEQPAEHVSIVRRVGASGKRISPNGPHIQPSDYYSSSEKSRDSTGEY